MQHEKEEVEPTCHIDFFFMESAPFLVMKMTPSGRLGAVALPDKSNTLYVQQALKRFVEESGHKRIVMMSDNEPAILAIKDSVAQLLKCEVVPRSCPVGDHQSNGHAEVGVREVKRQMRALRLALEKKLGVVLKNDQVLLAWMAPFAAEVINVHRVDQSGRTPYQKEFGRPWRQ